MSEVAVRYGVSRQAVYTWKARYASAGAYRAEGDLAQAQDFTEALSAETEALVCELRQAHPRCVKFGYAGDSLMTPELTDK